MCNHQTDAPEFIPGEPPNCMKRETLERLDPPTGDDVFSDTGGTSEDFAAASQLVAQILKHT